MAEHLNRLTKEDALEWDKAFNQFCKTGVWIMAEEFKINDLVEVTMWKGDQRRDWIIIGFASNGNEAIVRNIFNRARSIVMLSDLKHQKKEIQNGQIQ